MLFRACTTVQIGNGTRAKFWDSSWLQNKAPRDIAPSLYKLAWRKNLSVKEQLVNQNWTRSLWRMQSVEEMAEFVRLWDLIQDVHLNEAEDTITWKFTPDGQYSAKSAYEVQFRGSYCDFHQKRVWTVHAVPKHKFFTWLLIQEKILTADVMQARHWPCDPVCTLCRQSPETAIHPCLHCPYVQRVWDLVQVWTNNLIMRPETSFSIEDWWSQEMHLLTKERRRTWAAVNMYTVWNLWKNALWNLGDKKQN